MGKRWNGKKMSHGKKNLERPLKKARDITKSKPKKSKTKGVPSG